MGESEHGSFKEQLNLNYGSI